MEKIALRKTLLLRDRQHFLESPDENEIKIKNKCDPEILYFELHTYLIEQSAGLPNICEIIPLEDLDICVQVLFVQ
jgi:hypothetical protein